MTEIGEDFHPRFHDLCQSQDTIGWHRFMEGMISKEFVKLQREYFIACGYMMSIERWSSGLITRLLEITHVGSGYIVTLLCTTIPLDFWPHRRRKN